MSPPPAAGTIPPVSRQSLQDLFDVKGVHPRDVASALGVDRTTVYAWLSGHQRPYRTRWAAIGDVLGVSAKVIGDAVQETHRRSLRGER